jgi:hypothetical protein
VLKGEVIFGKGNKEAVGRLNAVAGDTLEIWFSAIHSRADSPSVTAYRAPLCSRPWLRPVAPGGDIVALQQRDA